MKRIKIVCVAAGFALLAVLSGCSALIDKAEPQQDGPIRKPVRNYPEIIGGYTVPADYPESVRQYIANRKTELLPLATLEASGLEEDLKQDTESIFYRFVNDLFCLERTTTKKEKDFTISAAPKDNPDAVQDFVFELYSFSGKEYNNNGNQKKGFGMVTDDRRLGNLIYFVEGKYDDSVLESDFMKMYHDLLEDYVQMTVEAWASITPEDLPSQDSHSVDASGRYTYLVKDGKYEFSSWAPNGSLSNWDCILKTHWKQRGNPFNECIKDVKGDFPAGCGVVQVAQIMVFHKYPQNFKSPNLNLIKSKWSPAANWDGVYDWSAFTNRNHKNYNLQIGAFLLDVGLGCKAEYTYS